MQRAVVRLAPEQITRLDVLAGRLRAAHPGRRCSRAAVVRAIVAGELPALEREGDDFAALAQRVVPPRAARRRSPCSQGT
jgi:hypothetical protein